MAKVYTVIISITENNEPTVSDTFLDQLGEVVDKWQDRGIRTNMQVTSKDS